MPDLSQIKRGTAMVLKMSANTSGATPTAVAMGRTRTFDRSTNMVEVTTSDSNNDAEYISGNRSWTMGLTGIFVDDASQQIVEDAWDDGEARDAELVFDGATYSGSVLVENISLSGDQGAEVTYNISLRGTGALTKA